MIHCSLVITGTVLLFAIPASSSSEGWQKAADTLHAAMDDSIDPCNNFYQFACGNWIKTNEIPPYLQSYDVMTKLMLDVVTEVSTLFKDTDPKTQPRAVHQAKIYFDACMGGETNDGNDDKYILKLLESYGKWPMIDQKWNGPIGGGDLLNSASALMGKLAGTLGVPTFMFGRTTRDLNTPKRLTIYPEAIFPSSSTISTVASYIKSVARTFANAAGVTLDEDVLATDATDLAELELKWAKIVEDSTVNMDYKIYNVSTAQKQWGYLDWTLMLRKMAEGNIDPDYMLKQPLLFQSTEPFDKLGPLMNNAPSRLLQNFFLWRLVLLEIQNLPSYAKHRDALYKLKMGTQEAIPATFVCVAQAMNTLPWSTGRLYVDQWRNKTASNSIDTLDGMIVQVLNAFKKMLSDLTWLDKETRAAADLKVAHVVRNVAYNDFVVNDTQLNVIYAGLDLSTHDDTFVQINKFLRFGVYTQMRLLGKPVDRTNMLQSPAIVNAWYNPSLNNINFPAAILNHPFFDAHWPMAVNYGAIGAIMGHELSHGFDNRGVYYDAYGNYRPGGWMTEYSKRGFKRMATCIEDQYSKFCMGAKSDKCVNGRITLGENIADNGGLMAAYLAYKSIATEPKLPAPMSKYSMDQVFFISFGHDWCDKVTEQGLEGEIENDHSPDEARVTVTLRNIPEFAEAFQCKTGPMKPEQHCSVWVNAPDAPSGNAMQPQAMSLLLWCFIVLLVFFLDH